MAKSFTIENPQALTDALNSLSLVASESVLRQAAVAGARVVFNEVKLRAPVGDSVYERKGSAHKPGTLRDAVLIAYDKNESVEGKIASYIVTWGKAGFYGRFLEYGTSKMAARPFLRPAFDATRKSAEDAVSEVIDQQVAEAKL